MSRTKPYDISAQSYINPGIWFTGDKAKLINLILQEAQKIIEEECTTEEYVKSSKTQAEFIIKTLYSELGWEVVIVWEANTPAKQ
ncbi:MAG TPA: hypothetical protein PLN21_01620 [Gemmatales bacterium]|nr:hypothetical protein [Gemmatales bacterium]